MDLSNLKLWPFAEAEKLISRVKSNLIRKSCVIFETGYGPSGLPHIGTFGEVLRTIMVIKAFKKFCDLPSKLLVFSDDMDGLRKVPENIPNKRLVTENLYKSLSSIPDPFEKFGSFSEHNNNKLIEFLNRFDFDFEFKSATNLYKNGIFNEGLKAILENYEKVRNTILPTLGKERRETYSPFLPICEHTGQVLQVKVEDINPEKKEITYFNKISNKYINVSILNGNCKLQWKVDWAMRWKVLEVDYEMNGKDLIESFQLSSKINKIIGGTPPINLTYELFLDENGEKISKSKGNGISVDEWLSFAPQESLELFMFQAPRKAKRLYFDVIPKFTDELLKYNNQFIEQNKEEKLNNPMWFINSKINEKIPESLSFNLILNLASVCNAENSSILWGFINKYYPNIDRKSSKFLNYLLEMAVCYYKKFIQPFKKHRVPDEKESEGLMLIIKFLKNINDSESSENIQNKIYEIGKTLKYESLKDWFSVIYEVVLGQTQGPRIGSFIKFYGRKEFILLVEKHLNR
tara:strand:+ start:68 stop:1624 length:1557 start_codon:yes stop_codon:yes gene_type:complete